ncbi:unnamed protein product [Ceratitis capitata]|uniref:(Mediterranean fruit fly) hypothetical protein n=1 Tax=Ceratitis capitata TaxID=7213 RepID=A0A811UYK7_CERCA|nr:unnamed protein product [Ceratitis capitata]
MPFPTMPSIFAAAFLLSPSCYFRTLGMFFYCCSCTFFSELIELLRQALKSPWEIGTIQYIRKLLLHTLPFFQFQLLSASNSLVYRQSTLSHSNLAIHPTFEVH